MAFSPQEVKREISIDAFTWYEAGVCGSCAADYRSSHHWPNYDVFWFALSTQARLQYLREFTGRPRATGFYG